MNQEINVNQRESLLMRMLTWCGHVIRGYLVTVGTVVTLLIVLLFFLANKIGSDFSSAGLHSTPLIGVGERVMVEVPLEGELLERLPRGPEALLAKLWSEQESYTLADLTRTLKRAKNDPRVKGVLFTVGDFESSSAVMGELRAALASFKTSSKKVVFHLNGLNATSYYLASLADEVVIPPLGDVMLVGPSMQLLYAGELLKKLGVSIDVIRAGKYKSAMEPLIADKPSEETYEMYRTLGESISREFVSTISQGRAQQPEVVTGWFKRSVYSSREALDAKIVDRIGYLTDLRTELKKSLDFDTSLTPDEYLAATDESSKGAVVLDKGKIALIEAVGTIYTDNGISGADKDTITVRQLVEELQWAAEESDIKAVVMRVESPGGSALASDIIWNEVNKLKKIKPIVVSFGSVAASGGYYISAPASKILAGPITITGSIGVISMRPNFSEFKDKYGISFYMISESERSSFLNPGAKPTAEDKEILGKLVDHTYDLFLERVAEGRNIPIETLRQIAEGRVYSGATALELKLIDQLGTLDDAFAEAKKLAKLDPEKLYPLEYYHPPKVSPLECLLSSDDFIECISSFKAKLKSSLLAETLPSSWNQGLAKVRTLERLFTHEKVLTLAPL